MPVTLFSLLLFAFLGLQSNARVINKFKSCPEMNNYYINRLIPMVGPYGINRRNVLAPIRSPSETKDSGRPGGPAGLIIDQPTGDPQLVAYSNITGSLGEDLNTDNNGQKAGVDYSTTNIQIKGVDEPDIIKTDGNRIYSITENVFSVIQVLDDGARGKRVGKLTLSSKPRVMLFKGDWILVAGDIYDYKRPIYNRFEVNPNDGEIGTVIYQIKILPTGKPRLVSTLQLEGYYKNSIEVDGIARFVLQYDQLSTAHLYYPKSNTDIAKARTKKWNREIIQYSKPGNWLPTYTLRRGKGVQSGVYASCDEIYHTQSPFSTFSLTTVVTLPINGLLTPIRGSSFISRADYVFATKKTMYVAASQYQLNDDRTRESDSGSDFTTSIHKFNLTDAGASYIASGKIAGSIINQFAMNEYRNIFFIATTNDTTLSNDGLGSSKITSFKTMEKTHTLKKIGQIGNLGIGELIDSVRYIQDTAYVSTFLDTNPMYTIDLSNPRKLKVTSELKMTSSNSYLHPVARGRILSVGEDFNSTYHRIGTKLTLFDVSDKTNPRELSTWTLRGSYMDRLWEHLGFLYWPKEHIAVIPLSVTKPRTFTGAIVLDISPTNITERGRIMQKRGKGNSTSIERIAVIGKTNLWTMSNDMLQVNAIKKPNVVKYQMSIA